MILPDLTVRTAANIGQLTEVVRHLPQCFPQLKLLIIIRKPRLFIILVFCNEIKNLMSSMKT